jgi:hypothetical protein
VARSSLHLGVMRCCARAALMGFLTLAATPRIARSSELAAAGAHPEFEAARRALLDGTRAQGVALAPPAGSVAAPAGSACALTAAGADTMTTQGCLACHSGRAGPAIREMHPVGAYRGGADLRAPAEVVRRGVFLPEGRIECVTCHDRRSPWKDHIALPPGSQALPAVDAGKPETYERRPNWRFPASPPSRLPEGAAVSAAPLCAACHTYAD